MFRRAARGVYRPMRPLRSAWFHEARSRRRRISRWLNSRSGWV